MTSATIAAAQVVVVAILVLAGQVIVARYSKKANDKTVAVQQDANAVAGFHQLVTDLQADMTRLRKDHNALRGDHAELGRHVERLEAERRRDKSLIRNLVAYIRILRDSLRLLGQPIPEEPGGIDFDNAQF